MPNLCKPYAPNACLHWAVYITRPILSLNSANEVPKTSGPGKLYALKHVCNNHRRCVWDTLHRESLSSNEELLAWQPGASAVFTARGALGRLNGNEEDQSLRSGLTYPHAVVAVMGGPSPL